MITIIYMYVYMYIMASTPLQPVAFHLAPGFSETPKPGPRCSIHSSPRRIWGIPGAPSHHRWLDTLKCSSFGGFFLGYPHVKHGKKPPYLHNTPGAFGVNSLNQKSSMVTEQWAPCGFDLPSFHHRTMVGNPWELKATRPGKHTKNYGKSLFYSWVNPLFLWSFSIATLNYRRLFALPNGWAKISMSNGEAHPTLDWFCLT